MKEQKKFYHQALAIGSYTLLSNAYSNITDLHIFSLPLKKGNLRIRRYFVNFLFVNSKRPQRTLCQGSICYGILKWIFNERAKIVLQSHIGNRVIPYCKMSKNLILLVNTEFCLKTTKVVQKWRFILCPKSTIFLAKTALFWKYHTLL